MLGQRASTAASSGPGLTEIKLKFSSKYLPPDSPHFYPSLPWRREGLGARMGQPLQPCSAPRSAEGLSCHLREPARPGLARQCTGAFASKGLSPGSRLPSFQGSQVPIQQKGTRPRESRGLFTEGKFPTLGILTLMHILTHLLLTPMPLAIRKELLWPTASRTLGHFSFPSRDQEPPLALLEFSLLQAMGFMSSGGSVLGIRPESREHFPFAARAMSCWGSWGQSRRVVPGAGLGRAAPVHTTRGSLAAENSNTMT